MNSHVATKRPVNGAAVRAVATAVVGAGFLLGGGEAMACGMSRSTVGSVPLHLPGFLLQIPPAGPGNRFPTLVGLWHTEFTGAPGTNFSYQSFDVWHADGTEFESADLPPTLGAVCVGVWKQTGPLSFELNHFGWQWNPASISPPTPLGSFNLIETINLSPNGVSYTGTFDLRPYDINGNFEPEQEVKGTMASTRITVDQHGAD